MKFADVWKSLEENDLKIEIGILLELGSLSPFYFFKPICNFFYFPLYLCVCVCVFRCACEVYVSFCAGAYGPAYVLAYIHILYICVCMYIYVYACVFEKEL